MPTLFISDTHLHPSRPAITETFISFLQQQAVKADALYLLGDIFEVWIGDDEDSPWHQQIKSALKQLHDHGVPIYFMHGNRDFLIAKRFLKDTACQLLADPSVITVYDKKMVLMHGDTLCLDDKSYLRFRRFNRIRWIQRLFLLLPLDYRRKLANKVRSISQHKDTRLQDITDSEIPRLIQHYQADGLIHGHTHRPAIHYFNLDSTPLLHIVLSDWHKQGNVFAIEKDGRMALSYF